MFKLFSKKEKKYSPTIVYQHLRFQPTKITEWLEKGGEIGTDNWNFDEQVVYSIFSFSNPEVHYHKNGNQFSHTVAGIATVGDMSEPLEWELARDHFTVFSAHERKVFFRCSLLDIQKMLSTGDNGNPNISKEAEKIIEVQDPFETGCSKVLRKYVSDFGLIYRNDLFTLDVAIPSSHHTTDYDG
jgi:hypothetical protein